jgi:hypothetical protein
MRRWLLDLLLRLGPLCGDLNCTLCGPTLERIQRRKETK